jgi:hypothetical protein
MAFITTLEVAGRKYPAAYVRASVVRSNKSFTLVQLTAWETRELKEQGVPALQLDIPMREFITQLDLPSDNPVDYAYKLLEAGGEFPESKWNI